MSSSPSAQAGDSTPWYASFREFCASDCNDRVGESWHLSPEQSLLLHAENTVLPAPVVLYSAKGKSHTMNLLFARFPLLPQAAFDATADKKVSLINFDYNDGWPAQPVST